MTTYTMESLIQDENPDNLFKKLKLIGIAFLGISLIVNGISVLALAASLSTHTVE